MVNIEILNETDEKMTFILEGEDPSFAGELRRIMTSEIPTMAIQYVDFIENDSGLYDEVLAHRIGLVPWTWDLDAYDLKEECKCKGEGCSRCEVQFALEREGPGRILAGDLKSTDESVEAVDEDIILVDLLEGQKLEFEATASLGFGKDHPKHQASVVGYEYYPEKIVVDPESETEELMEDLPDEIIEEDDGKIIITDPIKHDPSLTDLSKLSHKIEGDENRIVFNVESVCALTARQILEQSLDIMTDKAEDLKAKVSEL